MSASTHCGHCDHDYRGSMEWLRKNRSLLSWSAFYWIITGAIAFGMGVAASSSQATWGGLSLAAVVYLAIVASRVMRDR